MSEHEASTREQSKHENGASRKVEVVQSVVTDVAGQDGTSDGVIEEIEEAAVTSSGGEETPGRADRPEGNQPNTSTEASKGENVTDKSTGKHAGHGEPATAASQGNSQSGTEEAGADVAREKDALKEQLLRTAADFDNFRKRVLREKEELARRAKEETIREMLPVVDNLERALQAAATGNAGSAIVDGVNMVLAHFRESVCGNLQLERIEAVGQRFDPNVHEAVQQEASAEAPGSVIRELVAGYRLAGKLIRPAMVVVAKPQGSGQSERSGESDPGNKTN